MRYAVLVLLLASSPAFAAEPPPSSSRPLRGPVRVRLGTAMGNVIADTTMKVFEEIPKAIVDSVKRGDFQLNYKFSVNGSPPLEGRIMPSAPVQPTPVPQRRWLLPRR